MNAQRRTDETRIVYHISTITVILIMLFGTNALAQQANIGTGISSQTLIDSADVAKARIDFAVPDAPAFKIMDADPSIIMKPGTLREVGVAVANFLGNGGTLPKTFATEISPGLLLGRASLGDYINNPFWYRIRVSAATTTEPDRGTNLGIGFRITLVDESDLRGDKALLNRLIPIGHTIEQRESACSEAIIEKYPKFKNPDSIINDAKHFGALIDSCFRSERAGIDSDFNTMIANAREQAKRMNWNKTILELGLAGLASSPDSLAKNLSAEKYAFWLTAGFPLLGQSGQLLIALQATLDRGNDHILNHGNFAVASRGYFGENGYKGFLEGDWQLGDEQLPSFTAILGGELNLTNGIWLDASFGIQRTGVGEAKFVSAMNLRFATPELSGPK